MAEKLGSIGLFLALQAAYVTEKVVSARLQLGDRWQETPGTVSWQSLWHYYNPIPSKQGRTIAQRTCGKTARGQTS